MTWLHGEVLITKETGSIPTDAQKATAAEGSYKVADSETTGNHHLLEEVEGVDVFEKGGMFYVSPSKPLTVRCVDEKRHDRITLPPLKKGEFYKFDKQQEYDHLLDEVRAVQD